MTIAIGAAPFLPSSSTTSTDRLVSSITPTASVSAVRGWTMTTSPSKSKLPATNEKSKRPRPVRPMSARCSTRSVWAANPSSDGWRQTRSCCGCGAEGRASSSCWLTKGEVSEQRLVGVVGRARRRGATATIRA